MDSGAIHTVVLLAATGAGLAAIIAAALGWLGRRSGTGAEPRHTSPIQVMQACWPFLAIGVLDSLVLRVTGTLVSEWLFPGLVTLAAELFGSSAPVLRWVRRAMIATAVVMTFHGWELLADGYSTKARLVIPGATTHRQWYTPISGLMKVDRHRTPR